MTDFFRRLSGSGSYGLSDPSIETLESTLRHEQSRRIGLEALVGKLRKECEEEDLRCKEEIQRREDLEMRCVAAERSNRKRLTGVVVRGQQVQSGPNVAEDEVGRLEDLLGAVSLPSVGEPQNILRKTWSHTDDGDDDSGGGIGQSLLDRPRSHSARSSNTRPMYDGGYSIHGKHASLRVVSVDLNVQKLSARVSQVEVRQDSKTGKAFAAYCVSVQAGPSDRWCVWRRYSEFKAMHEALEARYCGSSAVSVPLMPGTRRNFLLSGSITPRHCEERKQKLDEYIESILMDPILARERSVQHFLEGDLSSHD
eukprot:TRINITY_DN8960_c0_g1_i1.p1 TRINITY_DN8960_c0_g1~~TRINITY_DN8960_c0_g1_i1.p1  ORF type:complete len:311 (+),score=27.59 TRINITY_DN8960_c0_g1_i1:200-1132(+)